MRLRTFIQTISVTILLVLSAAFLFQLQKILRFGFDGLNATYLENMHHVVQASVVAKKNYLNRFGGLLAFNYDLTGVYLLARESKDERLIRSEMNRIQEQGAFDIVDILDPQGVALFNLNLSQRPEWINEVIRDKNGLVTISKNAELTLISLTPLDLYDEIVGYAMIGYRLNGALADELSAVTNLKTEFILASELGPPPEGYADTGLLDFSGHAVRVKIETHNRFLQLTNEKIRSGILLVGAFCFIAIIGLVYLLLDFGFLRGFSRLLTDIDISAQSLSQGRLPPRMSEKHSITEVHCLARSFNRFSESLAAYDLKTQEQSQIAAEAQKQSALAELAQDVAHNIRSPLSALDMFTLAMDGIPDESRAFVRGAIGRINDIANNLIQTSKRSREATENETSATRVTNQPLANLIDMLVSEKRVQYQARREVHLTFQVDHENYGLFALVNPSEFKTMLSNLIDNGIEALEGEGNIEVSLTAVEDKLFVRVQDDGRGIAPEIQSSLGQRGATYGKTGGSGIGLFHAKTLVKEWHGELELQPGGERGTVATIQLPKAAPPAWHTPFLTIPDGSTIVILDDDLNVHQVWARRFDALDTEARDIALVHFSTPEELADWTKATALSATQRPRLILCDYDLKSDQETGLDCIERLGIQRDAVLVTGLADTEAIQNRCLGLGLALLPKFLAPSVPLHFGNA